MNRMNYRMVVSGMFIFVSTFLVAQNNTKINKKGFHKQLQERSTEQIHQLKDGALLVCLKTNELTLASLRKNGKTVQADALEKNQAAINQNIITAFREQFNFCPVYFFYSNYSPAIKDRKFDNVVFLNDTLQPDPTIKFSKKSFLIAHFGVVLQDTAKYLEGREIVSDGNFSVKEIKTYYGGPNFGYDGLVISSDAFVQLRSPFPYFQRTFDSKLKRKVLNRVVKRMNKRLTSFYNSRSSTV